MSQEPAVYSTMPRVSAAGAERLWRQFSELGQAHARRAASSEAESRLCSDGASALFSERPSTSCSARRAAFGRRCATSSRRPQAAPYTASPRTSQLLQTPAREGTCPTR